MLAIIALVLFVGTSEDVEPASASSALASSSESPTDAQSSTLASSSESPADVQSSALPPAPVHELTIPSLASIGLAQDNYVVGNFNAQVEECLQFPQLPGGCEVASMVSVLRALGFETDLLAFADDYVLKVEGQPEMVYSYSGTPYDAGAAFPPAMARAGNAYLKDQGTHWRFVEPDAPSLDDLIRIVKTGRPVLVWTTMYGASPALTSIVIENYEWYSNEHCVVLYGLTEEGDLQIMDPMVGLTAQNRAQFEDIYKACGQHALVPTQTQTSAVDAAEFKLMASFLDTEQASENSASSADTPAELSN